MLSRRSSMRRSYRPTGPDVATVELVIARASYNGVPLCELCGDPIDGERGIDWALHHRRGRDGLPDSNTPQNLLLVQGRDNVSACHGRIHRNRENESIDHGWLISRNAVDRDPLHRAVLLFGDRYVYLRADGSVSLHPPMEVAG